MTRTRIDVFKMSFTDSSDSTVPRELVLSAGSGIGLNSFTKAGLEQLIKAEQQRAIPLFTLKCYSFHASLPDIRSIATAEEILIIINSNITQKIKVVLRRNSNSIEDVSNTVIRFLENYRKEISSTQSDDEKLIAIVKVIQNLHQLHPFADGNGRTFCFFLLNRLLLDNNLPPTIIKVPGYFTGWSAEELVQEVKEGQKRFLSLCSFKNAKAPIVETIQKRFNSLSQEKIDQPSCDSAMYMQKHIEQKIFSHTNNFFTPKHLLSQHFF